MSTEQTAPTTEVATEQPQQTEAPVASVVAEKPEATAEAKPEVSTETVAKEASTEPAPAPEANVSEEAQKAEEVPQPGAADVEIKDEEAPTEPTADARTQDLTISKGWLKKLNRFQFPLSKRFYILGEDDACIALEQLVLVHKKKVRRQNEADATYGKQNEDLFRDLATATVSKKGLLLAYRSEAATELPVALINLRNLETISPASGANFTIKLSRPERVYTFAAASTQEAQAWVKTLQNIKNSAEELPKMDEVAAYQTSLTALESRTAFIGKPKAKVAAEAVLSDSDAVLTEDDAAHKEEGESSAREEAKKKKRFSFFPIKAGTPSDAVKTSPEEKPAEEASPAAESAAAAEIPTVEVEDDTVKAAEAKQAPLKKEGILATISTFARKKSFFKDETQASDEKPATSPEPSSVADETGIPTPKSEEATPVQTEKEEPVQKPVEEPASEEPAKAEQAPPAAEEPTAVAAAVPTEAQVPAETTAESHEDAVKEAKEEVSPAAETKAEQVAEASELPTPPTSPATAAKKGFFKDFGTLFRRGSKNVSSDGKGKEEAAPQTVPTEAEEPKGSAETTEKAELASDLPVQETVPEAAEAKDVAEDVPAAVEPSEEVPAVPEKEATATPKAKKRFTIFGFGARKEDHKPIVEELGHLEQPTSEGSTAQEKAVDNGEAETAKPQQEEDIQTKEAEEQKPLAEDAVEVSEKVQPTEAEIAQPAEVPVVPEKEATPTPAAEQSAAVPITPTSKGLFVLPKAPTLKKLFSPFAKKNQASAPTSSELAAVDAGGADATAEPKDTAAPALDVPIKETSIAAEINEAVEAAAESVKAESVALAAEPIKA